MAKETGIIKPSFPSDRTDNPWSWFWGLFKKKPVTTDKYRIVELEGKFWIETEIETILDVSILPWVKPKIYTDWKRINTGDGYPFYKRLEDAKAALDAFINPPKPTYHYL